MSAVIGYTASLATACLLLLAASWCLDTSVPEGLPERFQATVLDAVCRANWHIIKVLNNAGLSGASSYWRETVFPLVLGTLARGNPWNYWDDPELTKSETEYGDVPVTVYEPVALSGKVNRPVMVFFHGGWASLGADVYGPVARELAKKVSMVVVSVRIRKPPEHTHPTALEDCVKVTEHVIYQAHLHDLDPNKVGVAGVGAGGQLAAAVALKVKRLLKLQVLICPWLQLFDLQTPSYIENRKYLPGMRSEDSLLADWMRYGNISHEHRQMILDNRHTSTSLKKSKYASYMAPYLYTQKHIRTNELKSLEKPNDFGEEVVSDKLSSTVTDPLFAPLMADDKDFRYVPSTAYIVTAGYDVTREDGLIYWKRLRDAGIKAELAHYNEGFQGMLLFAGLDPTPSAFSMNFNVGRQVLENLIEFLKDNF